MKNSNFQVSTPEIPGIVNCTNYFPKQKQSEPQGEIPADVAAYGEAYDALCAGKGGRAFAKCACTSGYKESVNASDVTEMFLCVPEECQCGDGSKVDFPQLVWKTDFCTGILFTTRRGHA